MSPVVETRVNAHVGAIKWLTIAILTVGITYGVPFDYVEGGGGRYLLGVLQAADPKLFVADPTVIALTRFGSLFYDALAWIVHIIHLSPEALPNLLFALFVLSKFTLVILLYYTVRNSGEGLALLVLWTSWVGQVKNPFVGGDSLFVSQMTHTTVVEILAIAAIYLLIKDRPFWVWLILSIALFLHSVVVLQLALVLGAFTLVASHRAMVWRLGGILLFGTALFVYWFTYAPPSLSSAEGQLFLSLKGSIDHISPFSSDLAGWFRALITVVLAFTAYWVTARESRTMALLAWAAVLGVILGTGQGFLAVGTESVFLSRLQPMRLFTWVALFANLAIMLAAVRLLRDQRVNGIMLIAFGLLSIYDSLWSPIFGFLAIVGLVTTTPRFSRWIPTGKLEWWLRLSIIGVAGLMVAAWGASSQLPFESLADPVPLLVGAVIAGIVLWLALQNSNIQYHLIAGLLAYVSVFAAVSLHQKAEQRIDHDWTQVTDWVRTSTAVSDRFITPPDASNFRIRSLRTTVSENMSALVWVAPSAYEKLLVDIAAVNRAKVDDVWQVEDLFKQAVLLDATYVIVEEPFVANNTPVFAVGSYAVFRLP